MKTLFVIILLSLGSIACKAQKGTSNALTGKWIYVSSSQTDLGKIPENLLPQLSFDDSSKTVTGSTGCNGMNGSYATEGNQLIFGTMIITKKACQNMEVENYITPFLTNVGSYKIDSGKLYLYNKSDKSKYVIYKRNDII